MELIFGLFALLGVGDVVLDTTSYFQGAPSSFFLCPDGTFLVCTPYEVIHFDTDGDEIRVFGGRGQGPGEFLQLKWPVMFGKKYWVPDIDGTVTVLDAEGKYRSALALNVIQLGVSEGEPVLFAVLLRGGLWTGDAKMVTLFDETGHEIAAFHKPDRRLLEAYHLRYMRVFVVVLPNLIVVADEVNPMLFVYDKTGYDLLFERNLELPGYVPLDVDLEEAPNPGSRLQVEEWYHGWSHIVGVTIVDGGLAVAFQVPHAATDFWRTKIALVDLTGAFLQKEVTSDRGVLMGFQSGYAWFFDEDEDTMVQFVKKVALP